MIKRKVAVLISGNGTNLQALIDASRAIEYPAQIALVISNNANVFGLKRAEQAGLRAMAIDHRQYTDREAFDFAMHEEIFYSGAEIICLAGFMRLLSPWFVNEWKGRILNIHPSLLPAFKGTHAIRDALAAGITETGCTVHFVNEQLDAGPIIAQARVKVEPGDTVESLHKRIHVAEHKLYPQALSDVILTLKRAPSKTA